VLDKKREDCAEGNLVSSLCTDHSLGKNLNNFKLKCKLGSCDHEYLVFDFKCYTVSQGCEESPCRCNYWKSNYLAMCEELDNIDWDNLLLHDSIGTCSRI